MFLTGARVFTDGQLFVANASIGIHMFNTAIDAHVRRSHSQVRYTNNFFLYSLFLRVLQVLQLQRNKRNSLCYLLIKIAQLCETYFITHFFVLRFISYNVCNVILYLKNNSFAIIKENCSPSLHI